MSTPRLLLLGLGALILSSVARADDQNLDLSETMTLTSGFMSFKQEGADPKTGTNASNLGLEWAHFTKKDLAIYSSYRIAQDNDTKRNLYQAGAGGFRYFPTTLGMPLGAFRNLSVIHYDFAFKPHIDMGLVLGRYLVNTVFKNNAADYSSEFWGLNVGGGVVYGVGERYAIDLKAAYEYDIGYGPLDFSASTLFVLLGMVYYI